MTFNIELIGYLASAFTIISLTCENVMNLRVLNLIGSSIWIVYGVKKHSNSIVVANTIVVITQIYLIYRLINGLDNSESSGKKNNSDNETSTKIT